MPLSKPSFSAFLIGVAALLSAGPIATQTLEHRPPAKPAAPAQSKSAAKAAPPGQPVLPAGTCLQVEILRHYPMKAGESLEGRLVYPIYFEGGQVLAQNTLLHGTVTNLQP